MRRLARTRGWPIRVGREWPEVFRALGEVQVQGHYSLVRAPGQLWRGGRRAEPALMNALALAIETIVAD